jgi:transcriptional regulator with XRE-family HTH domain
VGERKTGVNGSDITRWRSLNRVKQSALADMVGVSQATVSKWERGTWEPTRAMALRLRDVMLGLHEGRLAAEIACLRPQQNIRALARGPRFQIVGVSEGFRRAWPQTSDLIGAETRRHLINEAAHYCDGSDYLREAADGELLMVSCVSSRILSLGDAPQEDLRLRWHAVIRHIDGELIHEMIYEPCAADTPIGFERLLRRSDISAQAY